ncbi:hypothetical protein D3C87_148370 [compost metagenome]
MMSIIFDKRHHVSRSARSIRPWYGGVAASLLAVSGLMWSLGGKNVKEDPSIRKMFYRGAKEHFTFITDHLMKVLRHRTAGSILRLLSIHPFRLKLRLKENQYKL